MMGFFTKKNHYTMKEATNKSKGKKSLDNLEHFNRIQKNKMSEFLGGSDNQNYDSKKRGFFSWLSGPKPCDGDLPH